MIRVKICGITSEEDALAAVDCGADALGFVFALSPRRMGVEAVRDIVAKLPPFVTKVGVFVDSDLAEVSRIMSACSLDLAQLHGAESPDYCAALFPRTVKVFTAATLPTAGEIARYRAAALMLDREKGKAQGSEDDSRLWRLARDVAAHGPVILAGGLTPENVCRAIEVARPYAVDVSSGIESEPGRKDPGKLRDFIAAVRQAEHSAAANPQGSADEALQNPRSRPACLP